MTDEPKQGLATLEPNGGEIAPHESPALDVVQLLDHAISAGMGVEQLDKLVALQERMLDRQGRTEFAAALAAFQAECAPIGKNKTVSGGNFGYQFASLDQIAEHIRPLLAKHGLSYTFDSEITDQSVKALCFVRHAGGHRETTTFIAPIDRGASMNAPQKVASATSYARRYALTLALGLTTGDAEADDDGIKSGAQKIDDAQAATIKSKLRESGADVKAFLKYMGAANVEEISAHDYQRAVESLNEKIRRKASAGP